MRAMIGVSDAYIHTVGILVCDNCIRKVNNISIDR